MPFDEWRRRPAENDEIDELVSISIDCARRVEEALQQTREVVSQTRRKMRICVAVAVCGILTLIVPVALHRPTGFGGASAVNAITTTSHPAAEPRATRQDDPAVSREGNPAVDQAPRAAALLPAARDGQAATPQAPAPASEATSAPLTAGMAARPTKSEAGADSSRARETREAPTRRSPPPRTHVLEQTTATMTVTAPPASAGGRVVIHYRGDSSAGIANRMASIASPLAARVQTRIVDGTPSRAEIRYFHSDDEQKARELADTLRGLAPELSVRNFTAYRPGPSPGTLEVWVPSRG